MTVAVVSVDSNKSEYPGIDADELARLRFMKFPEERIARLSSVRASGELQRLEAVAKVPAGPHRDRTEDGARRKFIERAITRHRIPASVLTFIFSDNSDFVVPQGPITRALGQAAADIAPALPKISTTAWNGPSNAATAG